MLLIDWIGVKASLSRMIQLLAAAIVFTLISLLHSSL